MPCGVGLFGLDGYDIVELQVTVMISFSMRVPSSRIILDVGPASAGKPGIRHAADADIDGEDASRQRLHRQRLGAERIAGGGDEKRAAVAPPKAAEVGISTGSCTMRSTRPSGS